MLFVLTLGLAAPAAALMPGDLLMVDEFGARLLHFQSATNVLSKSLDVPDVAGTAVYDPHLSYVYYGVDHATARVRRADPGVQTWSVVSASDLAEPRTIEPGQVRVAELAVGSQGVLYVVDDAEAGGAVYARYPASGAVQLLSEADDVQAFLAAQASLVTSNFSFSGVSFHAGDGSLRLLGVGADADGDARGVVIRAASDGTPTDMWAVGGKHAVWSAPLTTLAGTVLVLAAAADGTQSLVEVSESPETTVQLSSAELADMTGDAAVPFVDLAWGPAGRLYLLANNGLVVSVELEAAGGAADSVQVHLEPADYAVLAGGAPPVGSLSALVVVETARETFTVTEQSNPAGHVTSRVSSVVRNRPYQSVLAPLESGGDRFGFWTLNGQRQTAVDGYSLMRLRFPVTGDVELTAQYFNASLDGDGDGLPDWWEYFNFGHRDYNPSDNLDGDAFTLIEEFRRGYGPLSPDTFQPGGLSARASAVVQLVPVTAIRHVRKSEPLGLVADVDEWVPGGTQLTTPNLAGVTDSGYTFVGWWVNGVREAAPSGYSRGRVTRVATEDIEFVARFVPSNADTDGDGILDALEWLSWGTLDYTELDDPDGDGILPLVEQARGYSLFLPDRLRAGGLSARASSTVTFALGKALYTVSSLPVGLVPESSEYVDIGSTRTSPLVTDSNFGYWTVNGVRIADPSGISRQRITTVVTGRTDVVAHFFASGDSDGDGLDDRFEYFHFGSLDYSGDDDPDGDGFTLAEEARRGYSATTRDIQQTGGLSARASSVITFSTGTHVRVTSRSEPRGILSETETWIANGALYTTIQAGLDQTRLGYAFSHWTRDGQRVANHEGISLDPVRIHPTEHTEMIAHFHFPSVDSDLDGIPDYLELRFADSLDVLDANTDLDGDGFTLHEELRRGYAPTARDVLRAGGISARASHVVAAAFDGSAVTVDFSTNPVLEGLPAGTVLTGFDILDSGGGPKTVELVLGDGSDDNALFAIENGNLVATRPLVFPGDSPRFIRVRVRDDAGRSLEKPLVLYVEPSPPSTFERFVFLYLRHRLAIDPSAGDREADPDRDGINNFHEYVFGLDPLRNDPVPFRILPVEPVDGGMPDSLSFAFSWRQGMLDADHQMEISYDLDNWLPVAHEVTHSEELTPGVHRVTIRVDRPDTESTSEFYRLRITVD